jgi:hypothetical protein
MRPSCLDSPNECPRPACDRRSRSGRGQDGENLLTEEDKAAVLRVGEDVIDTGI